MEGPLLSQESVTIEWPKPRGQTGRVSLNGHVNKEWFRLETGSGPKSGGHYYSPAAPTTRKKEERGDSDLQENQNRYQIFSMLFFSNISVSRE
ncbi:hypothetical protein TNCT_643801 [Trichonephila clavata]|uniref:Uncharacterized protein n=1 Tax=Trichonephila clavata TaxID=2740835 RepID=A0A8X6JH27_TRICU|nr:hypothetical protein TNCT_643801 [Trichonephila clavata]